MRIGYSEDEDFAGQFGLWQANCERSLKGKRGQVALRELEAALLALPEKRLIAEELQNDKGEVCGVGALAKFKGRIDEEMRESGEYDMEAVGVALGMPRLVAWKVVAKNDIDFNTPDLVFLEGPYRWPSERPHIYERTTPEIRYNKMLAWVRDKIQPTGTASGLSRTVE